MIERRIRRPRLIGKAPEGRDLVASRSEGFDPKMHQSNSRVCPCQPPRTVSLSDGLGNGDWLGLYSACACPRFPGKVVGG
jgi:hypothetical protein